MSFSAGGSGVRSDINITPLVDVVLVLLIIFMVATPIMQMGLDVEVPPKVEVTGPPSTAEKNQLVINVRGDGLYLNDTKLASPQALRDQLVAQLNSRAAAERVVFINADDTVPFDRAVAAMDVAKEAGAQKVGFLTESPK